MIEDLDASEFDVNWLSVTKMATVELLDVEKAEYFEAHCEVNGIEYKKESDNVYQIRVTQVLE